MATNLRSAVLSAGAADRLTRPTFSGAPPQLKPGADMRLKPSRCELRLFAPNVDPNAANLPELIRKRNTVINPKQAPKDQEAASAP
jgi:hypothetical protein